MMTEQPRDRAGLEVLSAEECLRLIASVPVGRVGFVADGEVVMLPVNHLVDGPDLVFRTAAGSKLSAAEQQNIAAFEADHFDEQARTGWSVLVSGRAEAVYDEAEVERLNRRGLQPWPGTADRSAWVRIRALSLTGRRIPASSAS